MKDDITYVYTWLRMFQALIRLDVVDLLSSYCVVGLKQSRNEESRIMSHNDHTNDT